jgi:hypothetical protein
MKAKMKLVVLALLAIGLGSPVIGKDKPVKSDAGYNRVLVIGFEATNFVSNYYMNEQIAENSGLTIDSLEFHYNSFLMDKLSKDSETALVLIPVDNGKTLNNFYNCIDYAKSGKEGSVEIKDELKIKSILDEYNANHILFIDKYELNWEGEPFNTLFHVINYSILNEDEGKVYSGHAYFNIEKITPLDEIGKKYTKQVKKIIAQTEKTVLK